VTWRDLALCQNYPNRLWPWAYRTNGPDRFLSLVERDASGCWVWTGALNKQGYGRFSVGNGPGSTQSLAYRIAYIWLVGPVPEGLQLDHLCRVPACVNPEHLEPVTPSVNVRRGIGPAAHNAVKMRCKRGHPFEGDNVIDISARGRPGRKCKACVRLHTRWYNEKLRAVR
jgi:hypothetical protein